MLPVLRALHNDVRNVIGVAKIVRNGLYRIYHVLDGRFAVAVNEIAEPLGDHLPVDRGFLIRGGVVDKLVEIGADKGSLLREGAETHPRLAFDEYSRIAFGQLYYFGYAADARMIVKRGTACIGIARIAPANDYYPVIFADGGINCGNVCRITQIEAQYDVWHSHYAAQRDHRKRVSRICAHSLASFS